MKRVLSIVSNKYVVTTTLFVVWMLFIDQDNVINQVKARMKLAKLEHEREFYQNEIAKGKEELSVLQNDPIMLEKLAREKYLMKREDEEIFIFSGR
jgi:cell division protein FtsB